MNKNIILGTGLLLMGSVSAQAAIVTEWAAVASGSDIISSQTDGGNGINYAYVSSSLFQVEASLSGASYTPLLRAESTSINPSNADEWTSARAGGFQVFTSSTSQTINFNVNLHGIVSHTNGDSSYVLGDVKVVGGTDFFTSDTYCTGGTYALGTYLCGRNLGSSNLFIGDGELTLVDSISFNVNAGDSFAVYGLLRANTFDGSADAFHTLSMNFDDDTYLTAASITAVPLPAAAWLFLSGLVGLVQISRRKS